MTYEQKGDGQKHEKIQAKNKLGSKGRDIKNTPCPQRLESITSECLANKEIYSPK